MNAPACGCVWLPWGQLPARGTLWAVQDCDTQFEHDLNTAVEVQYRGRGTLEAAGAGHYQQLLPVVQPFDM
jgi:hypothetical protein